MLDYKQRRLITSWMELAGQDRADEYTRFMALWIAFNAYCYAYFGADAQRPRADVKKGAGLASIPPEPQRVDAHIQRQERRILIELDTPSVVRIQISERYTEDNIYASFAQHHTATYTALLGTPDFARAVEHLQEAIAKNGRHYVINMLKVQQHDPTRGFREMASDRTIIPFEDTTSLSQLKDVLYQIRCNIFHGEKVPGEPNDDRIVKAATPVLHQLLAELLKRENEAQ